MDKHMAQPNTGLLEFKGHLWKRTVCQGAVLGIPGTQPM